jgi:hypothetical protein
MKKNTTPLVDEHLRSIEGMREASTDDFFYTRLRARMEHRENDGWRFPFKPAWIIGMLTLLLVVNGFMLGSSLKTKKQDTSSITALQGFAQEYDQNIVTY